MNSKVQTINVGSKLNSCYKIILTLNQLSISEFFFLDWRIITKFEEWYEPWLNTYEWIGAYMCPYTSTSAFTYLSKFIYMYLYSSIYIYPHTNLILTCEFIWGLSPDIFARAAQRAFSGPIWRMRCLAASSKKGRTDESTPDKNTFTWINIYTYIYEYIFIDKYVNVYMYECICIYVYVYAKEGRTEEWTPDENTYT
jgi:hypothetical protein